MITALLVDDEPDARIGLYRNMPWKSLGIGHVQLAENAEEAKHIFNVLLPSILITDIRMPRINGIQLANYVQARLPGCKIIFISGYGDREYLKEAIRLKAVSYIEKPIDLSELESVLSETVTLIKKEREEQEKLIRFQSIAEDTRQLLMQRLALKVTAADGAKCARIINKLFPSFEEAHGHVYGWIVVRFSNLDDFSQELQEQWRDEIMQYIIRSYGELRLEYALAAFSDELRLIILCVWSGDADVADQRKTERALQLYLDRYGTAGLRRSVVVGTRVFSCADVPAAYTAAMSGVHELFFHDEDRTVYCGEQPPARACRLSEYDLSEYHACVELSDRDAAFAAIDRLTEKIRECGDTDINYIKNIYYSLYIRMIAEATKRKIELPIGGDAGYVWQNLREIDKLTDTAEFLKTLVGQYSEAAMDKEELGRAVYEVTQHIRKNYREPGLSIKSIAEHVHYNHYYLCNLFKKQTGKTINDYITHMRIEKAKELLGRKHLRLYDIARMVGYLDPSYFSKIFKRIVGIMPSEYRDSL